MKQKYTIGFIALVLTIVLAGCVHDYPSMTEDGEEGVDPTLVEVNTEVTLDLELVPLEIITQKNARSGTDNARSGTTKAATDCRRRFIIEAWRDGKPESRQVTVMEDAEEDGDASQNRNRSALQFARVRIVHDVFQQGDLDQTGMNPTDDQQREEEGD